MALELAEHRVHVGVCRRVDHHGGVELDGAGGQVRARDGHVLAANLHGPALLSDEQWGGAGGEEVVDKLAHGIRGIAQVGGDEHGDLAAVDRPGTAHLGQRLGRLHIGDILLLRVRQAEVVGHGLRESLVHVREHIEVAHLDRLLVALAQLEGQGLGEVVLLDVGERDVELAGLGEVVVEGRGLFTGDLAFHGDGHVDKCALVHGGLGRVVLVQRVRLVGRHAGVGADLVHAIAQVVVHRRLRAVDRQLRKVRPTQTGNLGIQVGKQAALQQRVGGDVDARGQVRRAERDLLNLFEVVARVFVQRHRADDLHRRQLLGHELGRVQQVDALEHLVLRVREDLHAQVPLRVGAGLDGVVKVATVEIRVHATGDLRFLPHLGVHAELRLPVELDQGSLARVVNEAERVDAKAFHHAQRARNTAVRHVPQRVVGRLGVQTDEVPERVVRRLRLRDLAIRVRLTRVDDVRELDGVLDEKHRDVVAHQVPVALFGVELRGPATGIAHGVGGAAGAQHGGKTHEDRGLSVLFEHLGLGNLRRVAVGHERAVGTHTTRVDGALRDALVVEVGDLLAEVVVLHQQRAPLAGAQRLRGLRQARTLGGGEVLALLRARIRGIRTGTEVERATGGRNRGRRLLRVGVLRRGGLAVGLRNARRRGARLTGCAIARRRRCVGGWGLVAHSSSTSQGMAVGARSSVAMRAPLGREKLLRSST